MSWSSTHVLFWIIGLMWGVYPMSIFVGTDCRVRTHTETIQTTSTDALTTSAKGPRFDSGPGLIPGSWIMMRHVSCILLLEWSTTSQRLWVYKISVPYAQKDPRFLFEKRRGQPREFWSLVSTIDGSTLPQVGVKNCYAEHQVPGKTYK